MNKETTQNLKSTVLIEKTIFFQDIIQDTILNCQKNLPRFNCAMQCNLTDVYTIETGNF